MWSAIRGHALRAIQAVVADLTAEWPDLRNRVQVESILNSPVFVDCELFKSGLGNSVGIYFDISIPPDDAMHAVPETLPLEVKIEFSIKFISLRGQDYDEEIEETATLYLDEMSWASAVPKLVHTCEEFVEFVHRNSATLNLWLGRLT
jgi:hypothetical protein